MNHVSEMSRKLARIEMNRKLARISELMNDGFVFVHMRELCEQWQFEADMGSPKAQQMIQSIDTFYRLCDYMKKT